MLTTVLNPDGPLNSKLGRRTVCHSSLRLVNSLLQEHPALGFELQQLSDAERLMSLVAKDGL